MRSAAAPRRPRPCPPPSHRARRAGRHRRPPPRRSGCGRPASLLAGRAKARQRSAPSRLCSMISTRAGFAAGPEAVQPGRNDLGIVEHDHIPGRNRPGRSRMRQSSSTGSPKAPRSRSGQAPRRVATDSYRAGRTTSSRAIARRSPAAGRSALPEARSRRGRHACNRRSRSAVAAAPPDGCPGRSAEQLCARGRRHVGGRPRRPPPSSRRSCRDRARARRA